MHTHRRVGCAKVVTEPDPNTTGPNEDDTNSNMCLLGQNCIPISYTNRLADVYPYIESYEPIEMCLLSLGIKRMITRMGILTP